MLPTVTSLVVASDRHHSRSASSQADAGGGSGERSLGPNEWTVTRLPSGVTPTSPGATVMPAEAPGVDGKAEGVSGVAVGEARSDDDAMGVVGATLGGAESAPQALASTPTAIARESHVPVDRTVAIPEYGIRVLREFRAWSPGEGRALGRRTWLPSWAPSETHPTSFGRTHSLRGPRWARWLRREPRPRRSDRAPDRPRPRSGRPEPPRRLS